MASLPIYSIPAIDCEVRYTESISAAEYEDSPIPDKSPPNSTTPSDDLEEHAPEDPHGARRKDPSMPTTDEYAAKTHVGGCAL